MTWFKVDDSFHSHVKAMRAGEAALGLWVLAGSWCAAQLTDGWIPAYAAKRLTPNAEALADELVRAGLWTADERDGEAGWLFHSWGDYQPTRESVEQRRKADTERRARWRAARKPGSSQGASRETSRRDTTRESQEASREVSALPDPARPGPDTSTEVSPPCSPPRGNERSIRTSSYPDGFEDFWSIYPKRVGKQAAVKAWRKAVKLATTEEILDGARRYRDARQGEDPKYTAHPSTWLNAGRWDDETQPAYSPPPEQSTKDQRIARLQALKSQFPDDPPGEERTLRALPSGGVA